MTSNTEVNTEEGSTHGTEEQKENGDVNTVTSRTTDVTHKAIKGFNRKEKVRQIKKVLASEKVDVSKLKQLAISPGGLVYDEIRRQVWPKLLSIDVENILPKPADEVLHGHRDHNQVVLDVNRSLKRFPPGMKEDVRMSMQDQLVDLIMRVLVNHEELHYYQGYHDICVTFLLVAGEDLAFALVDMLSLNHLRDFMDSNMDRTKHMLNYLYPIVGKANPKLRDFMEESEVGTIFSLSWLITWFGHVLNDLRHIVRLYDFFIACHPLMPIYLAASIVLYREKEILESECEMCALHGLLSKIPDNLPFEQLISKAGDLFLQYPPMEIANEAAEIFRKKRSALAKHREKAIRRQQEIINRKRGMLYRMTHQDGKNSFAKVTFWTVIGVITAAGLTMLNNYYGYQWYS